MCIRDRSDSSITIKLAVGGKLTARLGENLAANCAPGTSGSTPGPDPDVPEPGEDAPEPGENDEEPGEPGDEDTGDAADTGDASIAQEESGEDADDFNDEAFDREFGDDTGGGNATCDTPRLRTGAIVHKAKVTRGGSGPLLVAVELVRAGR